MIHGLIFIRDHILSEKEFFINIFLLSINGKFSIIQTKNHLDFDYFKQLANSFFKSP